MMDRRAMPAELIQEQIATLREQGFVVIRSLLAPASVAALRACVVRQLAESAAPLEYEADLRYPGAPASRSAQGGGTVRRLLDAYAREAQLAAWGTAPEIRDWMQAYFGTAAVLSRAHHNCVMTKHPAYGSLTGWHRDFRYWAFEQDDLISSWLALGPETPENGGLWLVPGSHKLAFGPEAFDSAKFFRTDVPENAELIGHACAPVLQAGDVVLFHCNTLHSAGKNTTGEVKLSLVYTYHGGHNAPLPGTRSAATAEVAL
jgi:phytanoyl-CoA hydroxylase